MATDHDDYAKLAFDLYKAVALEVFAVAETTARLMRGWDHHQAVCGALLVRCSKLMMSGLRLAADGDKHGEAMLILSRSIVESAVNVSYLALSKDASIYDHFICSGMKADVDLLDLIEANVRANGGQVKAIERRMSQSINNMLNQSGFTREQVVAAKRNWGRKGEKDYKGRLKRLGRERDYAIFQSVPSGAVHGDWSSLYLRHLTADGGDRKFYPNADWNPSEGKLFTTPASFTAQAALDYLRSCPDGDVIERLRQRLSELIVELMKNELLRPDWDAVN